MPSQGISKLGRPRKRYRPDRHNPKFETLSDKHLEDGRRSHGLCSELVIGSPRIDPNAAMRLADLLDNNAGGGSVEPSLASATHLRDLRIRFGGAIWKLTSDYPAAGWRLFTILSKAWVFTPEELQYVKPDRLQRTLRQDLRRAGLADTGGVIIGFLDGEYEPESGLWYLHYHLIGSKKSLDAVRELKKMKKFKPSKAPFIARPIQIETKPPSDPPSPFTYMLKFWKARRRGPVGNHGAVKRSRKASRVPEPFHSEALLWIHRWQIEDISLLIGVTTSKRGFVPNGKSGLKITK